MFKMTLPGIPFLSFCADITGSVGFIAATIIVLVAVCGVADTHTHTRFLSPYDDDENLVTALVPSLTACLASSPGSMRRTAVWISRELSVAFLLYVASFPASEAIRSKMSLMNEFMMDMPVLEIPVSGWTCLSTL
jgi:hypothetical protein